MNQTIKVLPYDVISNVLTSKQVLDTIHIEGEGET